MRSTLMLLAVTGFLAGCQSGTDPTPSAVEVTAANNVNDMVEVPSDTGDAKGGPPDASNDAAKPDSSEAADSDPADTQNSDTQNSDTDTATPADSPEKTTSDTPQVNRVAVSRQRPGDVEIITFDDLNIGMPADAKFREIMLQYNDGRAKSLLGKRINVAGYMNATDTLQGVKEFILLRNLECKFGPGGQADHLVHVLLQGDAETEFTDQVVYAEGVLELKVFPEDGPSTWSIYDLKATKVSTRPPPRRR